MQILNMARVLSEEARQSANKPASQLASELGSQPDRQPGSHPLRENMNLLRNNIFELPAGRDTIISLAERPMLFSGRVYQIKIRLLHRCRKLWSSSIFIL